MPTVTPVIQPTTKNNHKALRRKIPLLAARRGRKQDDDEDETAGTEESYTDDSGLSEDEGTITDDESEDDYDEDDAEMVDAVEQQPAQQQPAVVNGNGKTDVKRKKMSDTEAMKNGIGMRGTAEGGNTLESVSFDDMGAETNGGRKAVALEVRGKPPAVPESAGNQEPETDKGKRVETMSEKRRREHEEYKKKRAEDPAFVPNRGRFFMHDHRYDGNGSNGFRPYGPGGRGRGGRHGDFQRQPPPPELATEWPHDMHEQVETQERQNAPPPSQAPPPPPANGYSGNSFAAGRQRAPDQPRSFGRTIHKGTVQIQVNLPGMQTPITFSEVPWKAYTRLPYHRPPLRRDKPVRIALPEAPIRYIYPSMARSFIFIPRAMRPGGSGYIRGAGGRGRGGYPSGRSMYGGGSTVCSPSVGMSRRSSVQYDTRHHTPAQPIHPTGPPPPSQAPYSQESQTRPVANEEESGRPVVRLPSAAPSVTNGPSSSQSQAPKATTPRNVPQHPPPSYTPSIASYTPSSINPVPYREARATPKIPMYQPRPQKTVNVAEIDSPHVVHFPQNYAGGVYTEHIPSGAPSMTQNGFPQHSRHPSYPSQTSGTPLSQIPEAIHARPFHPGAYPPQGPYYHPYPPPHAHAHAHAHAHPVPMQTHHIPPHGGYHPPPPPYVASGPSPMPNGMTQHYTVPVPMAYQQPPPVQGPPPQSATGQPTGPTTIAQESNGMVYYSTWDPSNYYSSPGNAPPFTGTPGMPITPAPDGQGQNVGGTVYYYPPQPQPQPQPTGPVYYPQ